MEDQRIPPLLPRIALLLMFIGAAWMAWLGSTGYGSIFNPLSKYGIIHVLGGIVIIAALAAFFPIHRLGAAILLFLGSVISIFIFLAKAESCDWSVASFISQGIRVVLPWALLLATMSPRWPEPSLRQCLKVGIALTFIGHGLKALGWPAATPEVFHQLIIGCLGEGGMATGKLLGIAGTLDILAAIGIFIPSFRRPALIYMVAWGCITAVARPWASIDELGLAQGLISGTPELFFRTPHFFIPLFLLLAVTSKPMNSRRLDISSLS